MIDKNKNEIIFECKEPNCDGVVRYAPKMVMGLMRFDKPSIEDEPKTIYLKCSKGHTHKYELCGR